MATDAGEALVWLDDSTSNVPHLVTLQGGYEKFETWAEVEKFALPKSLFSEEDGGEFEEEMDELADTAEASLALSTGNMDKHLSMSSADSEATRSATPDSLHSQQSSMSPVSPPESPVRTPVKPRPQEGKNVVAKGALRSDSANKRTNNDVSDSGVPPHLRSLFNYILWRVQQEIDPAAALESFIFLCDDPIKAKIAQRFGIRVKSLADIRFVVAREEREFRNRQVVQRKEKENEKVLSTATLDGKNAVTDATAMEVDPAKEEEQSDDEDEVVFKRTPKAPAAMIAAQSSPRLANKVLDPNQFSRGSSGRGNARNAAARGGGNGRGRGVAATAAVKPGSGRGDVTAATNGHNGPIDPNSFSRPSPGGGRARGARKLFVPT